MLKDTQEASRAAGVREVSGEDGGEAVFERTESLAPQAGVLRTEALQQQTLPQWSRHWGDALRSPWELRGGEGLVNSCRRGVRSSGSLPPLIPESQQRRQL